MLENPNYSIRLPESPAAIVFVNGMIARNWRGLIWLWRTSSKIKKHLRQAPGCIQFKAGICGAKERVLVSYWEDSKALQDFYNSPFHRNLQKFLFKHPQHLVLYNETYTPGKAGKYHNEAQGLALIYPKLKS